MDMFGRRLRGFREVNDDSQATLVTSRDVMGPIRRDIVTLIDSRFACFHAYLAA